MRGQVADEDLADLPDPRAFEPDDSEDAAGSGREADIAQDGSRHSRCLEDRIGLRAARPRRKDLAQGPPDHQADDLGLRRRGDRHGFHHSAVAQDRHDVADLKELVERVRDEQRRPPSLAEATEHAEKPLDVLTLESSGRLVQDEDLRLPRQRLRDLDDLLLPDVERLDLPVDGELVTQPIEDLSRPSLHPAAIEKNVPAARLDPQRDVLRHGELGDKRELLMDDANSQPAGVIGIPRRHGLPLEAKAPVVGREDAGENAHQSRLAGAVLAHDRVNDSPVNAERHLLERPNDAERLRDGHELENRLFRVLLVLGCGHVDVQTWLRVVPGLEPDRPEPQQPVIAIDPRRSPSGGNPAGDPWPSSCREGQAGSSPPACPD